VIVDSSFLSFATSSSWAFSGCGCAHMEKASSSCYLLQLRTGISPLGKVTSCGRAHLVLSYSMGAHSTFLMNWQCSCPWLFMPKFFIYIKAFSSCWKKIFSAKERWVTWDHFVLIQEESNATWAPWPQPSQTAFCHFATTWGATDFTTEKRYDWSKH
jgi:hypothetical protein